MQQRIKGDIYQDFVLSPCQLRSQNSIPPLRSHTSELFRSEIVTVKQTCSHSFLEKQYTIPDSLFGYEYCINSAISSITILPTDDFSRTCSVSNVALAF